MTAPRVSIITIVRNDRAGLERTRASVGEQAFADREWILIDGASTDSTAPLALDLLAKGEATGVSEPDRGIYDAMNKGLDRATGDYVLFLNAGDRLLGPDSLATALDRIAQAGSPDIAFFGSVMDFGDRRIERPVKPPGYVWHGQPGLHQATFFRRTLHIQHRFGDRYKICGDYDTLTRMSQAGAQMQSFPDIVGVNSFEANATSGKHKMRLAREALEIQRVVLKLPMWKRALSFGRRSVASGVFKLLTTLRERRQ